MIGLTPEELLTLNSSMSALRNELYLVLERVNTTLDQISSNIQNDRCVAKFEATKAKALDIKAKSNEELGKLIEFLSKQVAAYQISEEQAADKITKAIAMMRDIITTAQ